MLEIVKSPGQWVEDSGHSSSHEIENNFLYSHCSRYTVNKQCTWDQQPFALEVNMFSGFSTQCQKFFLSPI